MIEDHTDQIEQVTLGDRIKRMESRFFVGREQEKSLFISFARKDQHHERMPAKPTPKSIISTMTPCFASGMPSHKAIP
ncbi:hypothetical protein [Paenibacillus sp. FSL H8-0537]|uniref:hypothetical protein n=1 Tax=Paenibacillus sp. FSL H8-0537 TaxID=2921399 RepID=UPI00310118CA